MCIPTLFSNVLVTLRLARNESIFLRDAERAKFVEAVAPVLKAQRQVLELNSSAMLRHDGTAIGGEVNPCQTSCMCPCRAMTRSYAS
jgi:hypothetical protein